MTDSTTWMEETVRDSQEKLNEQIKKLNTQMFEIQVEVLEGGKLPTKAHTTDAGFDLYATEDISIMPGQVIKTPLNIRMKLPAGSWAQIETKSGLGSKGMLIYAGVIDESYRGLPHVIATNLNWNTTPDGKFELKPIVIKKGDKIAQMTMNPHANNFFITQVNSVDTNTSRGQNGFGSSGK